MKKEIPVLMYHQFIKNNNSDSKIRTFVTCKEFELQLKLLKFLGYKTITFKDLKNIGLENRFKKKYIILTVDDGYVNNYDYMFPLLKKYNMKAVVYLVAGIDYNKWDVEKYKEEKLPIMNDTQVKELLKSGLIEIGGHTFSHCSLPNISRKEKEFEIIEAKKNLENRFNINLTSFAYPYGHLDKETKEIVKKAGYSFAVSTDTGSGIIDNDLYDIRRSGIDRTSIFDFLRKIWRGYSIYKGKKWKKN